ncbi:MAG: DSD1 family PLP-dependent enzyme [Chloroflexota bacterium]|nr:DSD1 family PLP-dependent enzyme [Chloroflexota bacterium]
MSYSPIGCPVDALDTPALVVDLDALEANIAHISGEVRARGLGWRPHAKAHKSPAIAHRLLAAGAIGITCAKLGEAEVYVAAGIRDILIANQIVGPLKVRRLAALAAQSDVMVAVDNLDNARELDAAARDYGSRPRVLVELNIGMNRSGIAPGEAAVALAREVAACEGLRFAGLMGWEGHTVAIADPDQRHAAIRDAVGRLTDSVESCRAAGLNVEIVSCGGTGTFLISGTLPGITEIQAGGGIFGDALYRALGVDLVPALTLRVGVCSRPAPDRVIIDAGRKAVDPSNRPPEVRGLEAIGIAFSAEHGALTLAQESETPRVGDRLDLEIGYSDQAVHLHETLYAARGGIIEAVWPTSARGKLT